MLSLDQEILLRVNGGWVHPILDWIAATFTASGPWIVALVSLTLASLVFGDARLRACVVTCIIVFAISDGIIVRKGKQLVGRPRPPQVLTGIRMIHLARDAPPFVAFTLPLDIEFSAPVGPPHEPRSFPSGHAWNSFALATVIALCHRRRGWLVYPLAALIAFTRVYSGVHWPSDVIASAVLAPPVTLGIVFALDRAWTRFGPRFAPRVHARLPRLPALDASA